MKYFVIYLILINIVAVMVFVKDKRKATHHDKQRIPEARLHLLELLGGVFGVLVAMYCMRHKNRKFSYFFITYLVFLLWIVAFVMLFVENVI